MNLLDRGLVIMMRQRHLIYLFMGVVFITLLLCAQSMPKSFAYLSAPHQDTPLEDLWIDLRVGPPLIPLFNEAARSEDIARVDHPSQAGQLSGINNGKKMVIFKSIAETEQLLPEMAGEIDIIGYNLEHGPATPAEEQEDPVESIKKMRELADAHDLDLAFGPDHDFALSHGVDIAPYVDIFVLQIQRQQTNPGIVEAFVGPIVPQLREANPDLEISVQVRTEGDVQEIVELLESFSGDLDGISILTSPDTVDVAWELVAALRPYVSPPGQGIGEYTTIIIVAVVTAILLAGVIIYRRRQSSN